MKRFTVTCQYGGRWEEQVELPDDDLWLALPQHQIDDRVFALAIQLRARRQQPWPKETLYQIDGRRYTPD